MLPNEQVPWGMRIGNSMRNAQPMQLKGQSRENGVKHSREFENSWVMTQSCGKQWGLPKYHICKKEKESHLDQVVFRLNQNQSLSMEPKSNLPSPL